MVALRLGDLLQIGECRLDPRLCHRHEPFQGIVTETGDAFVVTDDAPGLLDFRAIAHGPETIGPFGHTLVAAPRHPAERSPRFNENDLATAFPRVTPRHFVAAGEPGA